MGVDEFSVTWWLVRVRVRIRVGRTPLSRGVVRRIGDSASRARGIMRTYARDKFTEGDWSLPGDPWDMIGASGGDPLMR